MNKRNCFCKKAGWYKDKSGGFSHAAEEDPSLLHNEVCSSVSFLKNFLKWALAGNDRDPHRNPVLPYSVVRWESGRYSLKRSRIFQGNRSCLYRRSQPGFGQFCLRMLFLGFLNRSAVSYKLLLIIMVIVSVCAEDTEKTQEYHKFSIQIPQLYHRPSV